MIVPRYTLNAFLEGELFPRVTLMVKGKKVQLDLLIRYLRVFGLQHRGHLTINQVKVCAKRQYRILCRIFHPDAGYFKEGDRFREIQDALEFISELKVRTPSSSIWRPRDVSIGSGFWEHTPTPLPRGWQYDRMW